MDNVQRPSGTNQIESEKPNAPKTRDIPIIGKVAGSTNAGIARPIYYKRIMKNELHKKAMLQLCIQLLTPLTPNYQRLYATFDSFWVPDSEVWTHADEFYAQRGGSTVQKINEMPNFAGKRLDWVTDGDNNTTTVITNTETWRDSWISTYIPRIGSSRVYLTQDVNTNIALCSMPPYNALVARGYPVIRNNFLRNKEYESEIKEYKDDTVSDEEWDSYMPNKINYGNHSKEIYQIYSRAKKMDSYYTNYRTELQGYQIEKPTDTTNEMLTWAQWENKIDMVRNSAENAQKRDVEILAELRGGVVADFLHKARHIGRKVVPLNYSVITQSTYNDTAIQEQFKALGKQGAYSFTLVDIPLYEGYPFLEEGTIHIFMTVQAETMFEKGIDRQMLNVKAFDIYRPDNAEKNDVMYTIETSTEDLTRYTEDNPLKVKGFKRKFNEYFKAPNIAFGDLTTAPYQRTYSTDREGAVIDKISEDDQIITNHTFQFFEMDENWIDTQFDMVEGTTDQWIFKREWLDYSDYMINKNLAYKLPIQTFVPGQGELGTEYLKVSGQNQIDFVGEIVFYGDLPIDESIKYDYTKWGEH